MAIKRVLGLLFLILSMIFSTLWFANHIISENALGKTFDHIDDVPKVKVGLLLGTSKILKSGNENL
ncbi:MAG: hypothetical protein K2Q22_02430, partial [Cytophagales bacterium]|nr:hypothetical protein [Cytophagales bacterium]